MAAPSSANRPYCWITQEQGFPEALAVTRVLLPTGPNQVSTLSSMLMSLSLASFISYLCYSLRSNCGLGCGVLVLRLITR